MRALFAISALCLLALIWAGFAIRRHIRVAARQKAQRENSPKPLHAMEAELQRDLHASHTKKGFFRGAPDSISDPIPGRNSSRPVQRESAMRPAHTSPAPLPAVPAASADQSQPSTPDLRKPPVSINGNKIERLDWEHFNKDLGDLSDPYQPRRNAGALAAARSAAHNRR